MKRRKGKFKSEDDKVGRDFREILSNYGKYTTKTEYYLFIGIPLLISTSIFVYFWVFEQSNINLLNHIVEMNKTSLTVIAILAGFNTTSLSIITASNNRVLIFLRKQKINDNSDSLLKQLVTFFAFAILIQLIVLIVGVIISMVSHNLFDVTVMLPFINGIYARIPLTLFGVLWLSTIIFTIIISIRNASLLYRYVLFIGSYEDER